MNLASEFQFNLKARLNRWFDLIYLTTKHFGHLFIIQTYFVWDQIIKNDWIMNIHNALFDTKWTKTKFGTQKLGPSIIQINSSNFRLEDNPIVFKSS